MATTPVVLIAAAQLANTVATLYTATRVKARIDKLTCTNEDTVAHTITFHIVASGGSATAANKASRKFDVFMTIPLHEI